MQDNEDNQKLDDFDEKDFLKQFFLTDIGHELRTPMSAILGFSSLLMQSELTETQHKFTQSIYEAADNLLVIINDILDYAKIESNLLQVETIDFPLRTLVLGIKNRLERNSRHKQINISINIDEQLPDFLKSDPSRIEQILIHLMNMVIRFSVYDNAVLYTYLLSYKNKVVKVRFELGNMGGDASPLDSLYEIFNASDNSNVISFVQHLGDAGFSFYIIKRMMELLNGKLSVERNGNSAKFICDFDFEVGKSTSPNVNNQQELKGLKVLLCEDNILSQELTKEILKRLGCEVTIVDNGLQGIEILENGKLLFDCVIMDIQMPTMGGLEATQKIRALPAPISGIPVIALTAKNVKDEKTQYVEAGINDYLSKPFTPSEISQKILQNLPNQTQRPNLDASTNAQNKNYQRRSHTLFDLDFLKDAFGNNPAIFQELLQVLANQFLQFKKEANNALPLKDWKMLAQAAQVIKVNLVAFGLKSLENKVTLIEQYAHKQENLDQIPELIRDCEEIFAGAIKELNSLLEDGNLTEGQHLFSGS
ncbi:hypothetical protein BKI52_18620 [marine bacterium AO1-C]|nr:hypothetical protein BKI52_18620 [marine bacterium AO1-C]